MASISNSLKASASAVALGTIIGIQPDVSQTSDGRFVVAYTGDKANDAADGLNAWLNTIANRQPTATKPGVVYDMNGVVVRVVLRQALPWLIGVGIIGYLGGYYTHKRKGGPRGR